MTKLLYPDFFNDVFGPIMQSGSSSNFAGMSRLGHAARYTLSSSPRRVRILFNPSDQQLLTLGNMMEDRGYLGGLQDLQRMIYDCSKPMNRPAHRKYPTNLLNCRRIIPIRAASPSIWRAWNAMYPASLVNPLAAA